MKESIRRRIDKLNEIINELNKIKEMSLDDFENIPYVQTATERFFHILIEILIDLGNYIIRMKNLGAPETYVDTFRILCDKNILSKDLKNDLENMTRLRNKLVHGYINIMNSVLLKIIKEKLEMIKYVSTTIIDVIKQLDK